MNLPPDILALVRVTEEPCPAPEPEPKPPVPDGCPWCGMG